MGDGLRRCSNLSERARQVSQYLNVLIDQPGSFAEFQELPGSPPSPELRLYLPTSEGQAATALPPPSALAWLTGTC